MSRYSDCFFCFGSEEAGGVALRAAGAAAGAAGRRAAGAVSRATLSAGWAAAVGDAATDEEALRRSAALARGPVDEASTAAEPNETERENSRCSSRDGKGGGGGSAADRGRLACRVRCCRAMCSKAAATAGVLVCRVSASERVRKANSA